MNYFPFHLGDYAAHTAHLDLLEDLAYRRMLDLYYRTEKPLPREIDQIARLIRMKGHEQAIELIIDEFFEDCSEGWMHVRCDAEIAKMQDKQAKARASAKASVNARSANAQRTLSERSTDVQLPTPTPTPTPIPIPIPKEEIHQPTVDCANPPDSPPTPPAIPSTPACPHGEILALWAEVLPSMPQHNPSLWRGTRADHLRARWRETAKEKGWADVSDGLAYFRKLFAYIGRSAFLTGRAAGKRPFHIELAWLVNPQNWAKVVEGKYHEEAA